MPVKLVEALQDVPLLYRMQSCLRGQIMPYKMCLYGM